MSSSAPFHHARPSLRYLLFPALLAVACGDPVGPDDGPGITPPPTDTATVLPPTSVSKSDLEPTGTVVETQDGYTVSGSLAMRTSDTTIIQFQNANVRVRFDENDRVTSISGSVHIPSPHPRIEFHDPIQSDVGFFRGSYLNEERDLGIRLRDDVDYFLFRYQTAIGMSIATGETGDEAVKPITLGVPGGGSLMIVDYMDPMYYVVGTAELIGDIGFGWSKNGRIPFVPDLPVAGLGSFDGTSIRTGTFPIFKVFSITGETVDTHPTEVHLTLEEPFDPGDLPRDFQQGWNGEFELDLSIKNYGGLTIPVSEGSGGIFADASDPTAFRGHVYGRGATTDNESWWPSFVPIRPIDARTVEAFATDAGQFEVAMTGKFSLDFPDGETGMAGAVDLGNEAFEISGTVLDRSEEFTLTGRITEEETAMIVEFPNSLLDAVAERVNGDILPRIDSAQKAWDDLQEATAEYEFELSLRGVRTQIPAIVDAARTSLSDGIAAELEPHEGKVYYGTLESQLKSRAQPYYDSLDRLEAEAKRTTDNASTRAAIDAALRDVASKKIFTTTITIKAPIVGTILYSKTISRRIMSDQNADKLLDAASHVPEITATSDRKISMQQIYDEVPDRQLFEQVRDDIRDGVIVIRDIGALGFVFPHAEGLRAFNGLVLIDGRRYETEPLTSMTVEAWAEVLWERMVDALKVN